MKLIANAWPTGVALAAALILAGPAAAQPAQAYVGDWEGALFAGGRTLRLVLHVTLADGETVAVLDSLDQGASLTAAAVKTDGGEFSALFLQAGGELKARLSADGKILEGSWSQGAMLPLKLTKKAAPAK
ncbi:hypothetical protein [Phenylobacterium sp.]|uniref:hypothetical protein n=1 Tax=Phenylobacterium sp. TaxID=1871053 RepID=UPI00286C4201|nr:hypothetical protein [Phenylobacterium sp.]